MDENNVEAVQEAEAVAAEALASAPAPAFETDSKKDSKPAKKGNTLLVVLTVLLILVGVVDLVLWAVVGYHFLQNRQSEADSEPSASTTGEPAGDTGSREALRKLSEEWNVPLGV